MTLFDRLKLQLRPLALELFVVTVGILLALGVDAWWQAKSDRHEERVILVALRSEFEQARGELSDARAIHETHQASAEQLLGMVGAPSPVLGDDSLGALWGRVIRYTTYDPSIGVLTALLASGRLHLIEDHELRSALAAWPSLLADAADSEDDARAMLMERFLPWLVTVSAIPNATEGLLPAGTLPTNYELLLNSPTFEGYLRIMITSDRIMLLENTGLMTEIDSIVSWIDRSLD